MILLSKKIKKKKLINSNQTFPKLKKMLSDVLYHFDLFKTPLTYRVNSKSCYSTPFGFLLSFPIFIFLIVSFFMSDLIQKKHPIISSQAIAGSGRPYMGFDKSNMTFAFRVTNDNSTAEIDESYLKVVIMNLVVNNTSHQVIALDTKETKKCDENDFDDPKYFKDYGITNATCAVNSSYEIGGYWTEPFVSYVRVLMEPCKNGSGVVCKSPNAIKEYLKNKYNHLFLCGNYNLN